MEDTMIDIFDSVGEPEIEQIDEQVDIIPIEQIVSSTQEQVNPTVNQIEQNNQNFISQASIDQTISQFNQANQVNLLIKLLNKFHN